jgi:hypothetical protein
MKFKLNLIVFLIMLFGFACTSTTDSNITGTWVIDFQTEQGSQNPSLDLVQEGEIITGTYTHKTGTFNYSGKAPVRGTIKDNNIQFRIVDYSGGFETIIQYIGTIEEDGSMKGTVKLGQESNLLGQMREFPFTGKKQEK